VSELCVVLCVVVLFFSSCSVGFYWPGCIFWFWFCRIFCLVSAFIATHVVRKQQNIKQVRSGRQERSSTDVLPYRKLGIQPKIYEIRMHHHFNHTLQAHFIKSWTILQVFVSFRLYQSNRNLIMNFFAFILQGSKRAIYFPPALHWFVFSTFSLKFIAFKKIS